MAVHLARRRQSDPEFLLSVSALALCGRVLPRALTVRRSAALGAGQSRSFGGSNKPRTMACPLWPGSITCWLTRSVRNTAITIPPVGLEHLWPMSWSRRAMSRPERSRCPEAASQKPPPFSRSANLSSALTSLSGSGSVEPASSGPWLLEDASETASEPHHQTVTPIMEKR